MARPEYTQGVSVSTESNAMTQASIFKTLTVDTTAIEVKAGTNRLIERTGIMLQADEDNGGSVFIGVNSEPTTTNASYRLSGGAGIILSIDKYADVPVYIIGSDAGQKVHITEVK